MSVKRAQALRKTMTPQEVALWLRLRELRAQGWHFRRQAPEPPYVLDFVCRAAKLIVEIDGAHHAGEAQDRHDKARDETLALRGYRTLRFWASDVETEIDGVVEAIMQALAASGPTRRALRTRHPPRSGEGRRRYAHLVRLGLQQED